MLSKYSFVQFPEIEPRYKFRNSPNHRIHPHAIYIVELLQCILNLPLIALDVADEDQRVVFLNLLHRRLRIERVDDDFVIVESGFMRDRFARVLGRAGQLQGLGSVEGCGEANLADFLGVYLREY